MLRYINIIINSSGQSLRFGSPKNLIKIKNYKLLNYIIFISSYIGFLKIFINKNNLGYNLIKDKIKLSQLSLIYTIQKSNIENNILIIPIDMININNKILFNTILISKNKYIYNYNIYPLILIKTKQLNIIIKIIIINYDNKKLSFKIINKIINNKKIINFFIKKIQTNINTKLCLNHIKYNNII